MNYPELNIIGLMSGTSLDGLDIAACTFSFDGINWVYKVRGAETFEYDEKRKQTLKNLMAASALDLAKENFHFGYFLGDSVNAFLEKYPFKADYVASHGHTIFHQPQHGFTLQIGHGACIAARAGIPVISDFRALDVAMGGQGAPLVPIGDKLLYADYNYCLNLGGIANISFDDEDGNRVAFDICPINMVLNDLAQKLGKAYDKGGALAETGRLNEGLLEQLEDLDFYKEAGPKSLGKEWVDKQVFPLLESFDIPIQDKLNTFCHHVARRIAAEIRYDGSKVLVTGGGAFNQYFINLLKEQAGSGVNIIVPDDETVMFKEAIVFAFLGYLRVLDVNNCLASVTGAARDNCGGMVTGKF